MDKIQRFLRLKSRNQEYHIKNNLNVVGVRYKTTQSLAKKILPVGDSASRVTQKGL